MISPAVALWNQRNLVATQLERFKTFSTTIEKNTDFTLSQWVQIAAMTLEFKPDIIIELGRLMGNSTCMFTECAHLLRAGKQIQVTSVCTSTVFRDNVVPELIQNGMVDDNWLNNLNCVVANILEYDFSHDIADKARVLLFWDAHGYDVAEYVLGEIMPKLQNREHIVIMHDMSDQRYVHPECSGYNGNGIWRGANSEGRRLVIGNINSAVEQAVAITDFAGRNGIELISADHSYHTEIGNDKNKYNELLSIMSDKYFSLFAHWICFSLNQVSHKIHFPVFQGKATK